jgi:hypothetical protein
MEKKGGYRESVGDDFWSFDLMYDHFLVLGRG